VKMSAERPKRHWTAVRRGQRSLKVEAGGSGGNERGEGTRFGVGGLSGVVLGTSADGPRRC